MKNRRKMKTKNNNVQNFTLFLKSKDIDNIQEFAQLIGVSSSRVYSVLAQAPRMRADTLLTWSNVLGESTEYVQTNLYSGKWQYD